MKTKIFLLLLTFINSNNIFSQTGRALLNKDAVADNPSLLVKLSFKRVSQNYPTTENSVNAFYKESVLKNGTALNSCEAILDISKSPYCSTKSDKITISDVRGDVKSNDLENYIIKLQGGPLSCLECDVVKHPFLGTFLHEIDENFDFIYKKREKLNGRETYIIDFKQKPGVNSSLFSGEIYIDSLSYAIVKVNYCMEVKNREWAYARFFKSIPKNSKISMVSANYKVAYKEHNNRWYLDYSSSDISFNILNKTESTYDIYNINSRIAVTGIFSANLIIDKRDFLKRSDVLIDKSQEVKYVDKWEQYNDIMLLTSANY
ncbi:MAG: hypothetical protein AB9922_11660 [Bacteroidales bacterium]